MDKILANKFLGLKVEDILKCVLLVGVGYCIAVMLGNFNCVEGLYQCTTGVNTCSTDEYEAGRCPGWQRQDGFNRDRPFISNFDEVLSCPDDDSSVDKGYQTQQECLLKLSELRAQYNTDQPFVSRIDACPNPTPLTPPTPPAPPAPPTPPSTCRYYGDDAHPTLENSAPLDDAFWNRRTGGATCHKSKEECRSAWQLWASETGNTYTGFCIQTLKDGKDDDPTLVASVRGDCPLGPGKTNEKFPDAWILDGDGTPEQNCTSLNRVGDPAARGGDFAWVNETSLSPCSCGASGTDTSATPGGGGSATPGGGGGAPPDNCHDCGFACNAASGGELCCEDQPTMWSLPCLEVEAATVAYGGPTFPNAPWNTQK